jgi:HEAT repeat protein
MSINKRFDCTTGVGARLGLLVGLGLLIASLAACGTSSGSARNAPAATGTPQTGLYRFIPGERLVYRLDYASASASDFRALFSEPNNKRTKIEQPAAPGLTQSFKTTIRGELTSTVISNSGDIALIAYSVHEPEVDLTVNGQAASKEAEKVRSDLVREVFARVNSQGKVLDVRFEPGVDDLSQSFVRTLLAITQFVLPEAAGSDLRQWETQEADPNGQYVARYAASNDSGRGAEETSRQSQGSFKKTKSRYLQPIQRPTADETQASNQIYPKGSLATRFDLQRGHLVSLSGTESLTVAIEGKTVANADTAIQMDLQRQEMLSQTDLERIRATSISREREAVAISLFVIPSPEAGEASIARSELGDTSLDSLLADLAKLESSSGEMNETPTYLKVKAMIYLHPESSAHFGKILATANSQGPAMRVLTGALGAVGNTEAQAALIGATRSRAGDWPAVSLLIPAISQVPSPAQPAEDLLRDLAFNSSNPDIAATAQLSLGNVARKVAQTSPDRAANIVRLFTKAIESSPSTDFTQQMLLAIGNAGSIEALPNIGRLINDPSPTLRATAAGALRWVDSDQADSLLIKALTSDREATVRLEAAIALSFRRIGNSTFNPQKTVFLTEQDVKVRLVVLKNLWAARDDFAEVRGILKRAAGHDRSKEVRKAAAESLGLK